MNQLNRRGDILPSSDARRQHALLSGHQARVRQDAVRLGANFYYLMLPETSALPLVIHPQELIGGLVYGRYVWVDNRTGRQVGRGVLVATNLRVVLIDKKPLFVHSEEIGYAAISGIAYSQVWPMGHVVLHTRLGDINMRTFNGTFARNFVACIEASIAAQSPSKQQ